MGWVGGGDVNIEDGYLDSLIDKRNKDPSEKGYESDPISSPTKKPLSKIQRHALTGPAKKGKLFEKLLTEQKRRTILPRKLVHPNLQSD